MNGWLPLVMLEFHLETPELNESSEKIMERREKNGNLQGVSQKFASTVKTPLYLYKEMEDSRLKRRVLKNINSTWN